jgi:cysteine desulfurase/selenocysteine lyase
MRQMSRGQDGANAMDEAATRERFEAGTPDIAGAVGMAAALEYIQQAGIGEISAHEQELLAYAQDRLQAVPRMCLIGTALNKVAMQSFVIAGVHSQDIKKRLAQQAIVVRAGDLSARPLLEQLGLESAVRMSLAFYNTRDDIDAMIGALIAALA